MNTVEYNKSYYEVHSDSIKRRMKLTRMHNKSIALSQYGGHCAVCGITDPAFLTIDHVNNDGAKHRIVGLRSGRLYAWLVSNDFPDGFQVLCWNHNWLKYTETVKSVSTQWTNWSGKIKRLVIDHYGSKCQCCGESNICILTVDHVNNDGNKHRSFVGQRIYKSIIDSGFPLSLRVLCFNCNSGRHMNGGLCPHEGDKYEW